MHKSKFGACITLLSFTAAVTTFIVLLLNMNDSSKSTREQNSIFLRRRPGDLLMNDARFYPILSMSAIGSKKTYDQLKDIIQVRLDSSNQHARSARAVEQGTSYVACSNVTYDLPNLLEEDMETENFICPQDPSKIVFNST